MEPEETGSMYRSLPLSLVIKAPPSSPSPSFLSGSLTPFRWARDAVLFIADYRDVDRSVFPIRLSPLSLSPPSLSLSRPSLPSPLLSREF